MSERPSECHLSRTARIRSLSGSSSRPTRRRIMPSNLPAMRSHASALGAAAFLETLNLVLEEVDAWPLARSRRS